MANKELKMHGENIQHPQLESAEFALPSYSYRQLIWRRFRKNRLGVIGALVIILLYVLVIFADFFAYYPITQRHASYASTPPQQIHFRDSREFSLRPFVYGVETSRDPETLRKLYSENKSEKYYIRFFVRGYSYRLLGVISTDIHLFGVDEPGTAFIFGTDSFGRDMYARVLAGGRVSLSVGLFGVLLSVVIGTIVGVASGYYGGTIDLVVQRAIEIIRSFPQIPLWMTLSAALPPDWPSTRVYFGIVTILALIGWTGLAREVRGKVLALREHDLTMSAKAIGINDWLIITRHLLPSTLSHVIVVATLAIPGTILAESALSYLGLGIKPPMTSWGVLLQDAQRVSVLAIQPWLIIPVIFIIVSVLAFNFMGDALRDAADPYM
jgi:peptide/nickel transport system permease protein